MEKTFVNALGYSRILRYLIIFVLVAIIVIDAFVIALVMKVIDYASPAERSRIILLVALLFLSSAAGFPLFYFAQRSLRDQWIKIDDQGITYNSWSKKISASWEQVTGVSIASRGRYGQALRHKALCIDTRKGKIYALPIFVDKSTPIPQLKYGMASKKLSYPDGRTKQIDTQNSDVYVELMNYIPNLLKALQDQQT